MSCSDASSRLVDDALPGFEELVHSEIPGPVAALYEAAGTSVESISLIQTTWWPGRQLTTRYRVTSEGGGLDGSRDVVAVIGNVPDGVTLVESPDVTVGLWVVPDDPLLPGLASAMDGPTVSRLLSDLGSHAEAARCRLRSYRPGRRAVVEVRAGPASIFLKVVPPSEVEGLHEKHRHLSVLMAVPDSLGLAKDLGIVVMPALPGSDLRSALRSGGALPEPQIIAGMVEEFRAPAEEWVTRSPIDTLPHILTLLEKLVPGECRRLAELAEQIGTERGDVQVPVHGDFHEAQILADGKRLLGLIDVDTYGWGRPGDDAATMLGHLHLLGPSTYDPSRTIALARELNRYWDSRYDPVDLRLRTAAVVLGLAPGPFRVNRPQWPEETIARIDIAERWVESARTVDERSLISTSGPSNGGPRG
jgi:Phosphotransferase enzyme family